MAGVSRLQYTDEIRFVRVMCSGRVDLEFIFRAFLRGMDGVFIGGCRLNECNYVTHGNYDALGNTYIGRRIMQHMGIDPLRLHIEFMNSGDGNILANSVNAFTEEIRDKGPLGKPEGIDPDEMESGLETVIRLVPWIKMVERERLRVHDRSEKGYRDFFTSEDFERLFSELIADRLDAGRIMLLLREKPLSTKEISEKMNLGPSEVARHMSRSSMQGLVRYDVETRCYAPA